MNAANIAFGIEIETTLPAGDDTPIMGYHSRRAMTPDYLPAGWKAERDSSIRTLVPGRKGAEFVSPILKGREGIENVMRAVRAISDRGARVNQSCGIHITFTFPQDAEALARLVTLFANHEQAIYASTGTKIREDGRWTKGHKVHGNATTAMQHLSRDRYQMVNLTHFARGQNRIEIRAFASSLNETKIAGYILMVLGLVQLALEANRNTKWDYKRKNANSKPAWFREGQPGLTEIRRLFYRLGWTKGQAKKVYGEDMLTEVIPTIKEIKKEFVRLAKKYDSIG